MLIPRPGRLTAPFAAAAGAVVITLSGCTGAPDSSPAAGDAPAETDPSASLVRFYDQELEWGSCEGKAASSSEAPAFVDPFECAELEVPLDYDAADGGAARLGLLRLAADGAPDERIGSVVVNPGGPGGSGTVQAAVASVTWMDTEIARRFDVVGFDPRGVGISEPAISCFTDDERDRGENQTTLLGTSGRWGEADTRGLAERCAEGSSGADVLSAVGTRDAARDMDVLREVLGDEQLTFAGQSYGTRLGAVYAEMFPEKVRAMVLDGVVDPAQGTAERRVDLHTGFQRSFDLMATSCAQQPDCPLGTNPAAATQVFQDLVQPLVDAPVPASDGRQVGFHEATGGVLSGLYYAEQWPAIISALTQLRDEQRGDQLLALGDVFGIRAPDGEWNNQLDAQLAINCNDEQRRTPEQEAQLRQDIIDVNPIVDPGFPVEGVTRDACEFWPEEPTLGIPYAQDVTDLAPALVVSVTGDPVTPYDAGVRVAESFGGALLTVEGERHTVAQSGLSPCVTEVVEAYLVDLQVPDDGATCRL